jgi:hypothetical protein
MNPRFGSFIYIIIPVSGHANQFKLSDILTVP